MLARLRAASSRFSFGDEIEAIENDCVRLHGGRLRAVLSTTDLNFLDASDDERARSVRGFADLLNSLTGPLQLWFRSQRMLPSGTSYSPTDPSDGVGAWRAATQQFIDTQLERRPIYKRSVALVLQPTHAGLPVRNLSLPGRIAGRWVAPVHSMRTPQEREWVDLERQTQSVTDHLARFGLRAQRLMTPALGSLFSALYGRPAPVGANWQPSHGRTGSFHAPSWFRVGQAYYRTFQLLAFPGGDLEPGWLAPLIDHAGDLQISLHITPVESDRVIGYLNSRIRDLRASQMAEMQDGHDDPRTEAALPQALALRGTLARNEERVFAVAVYVALIAPSLPDLRLRSEALRSTFTRMLVRAAPAYLRQREGLRTIWPWGQDTLARERLVHTSALSTFFPWLRADLFQPAGQYWGLNRRTGGLVVCDPFSADEFPNANVTIFGHSGAGKTYAASSIVLSGYAAGVGSIVLDPEHEYAGLCEALSGTYVEVACGSPHAINVLDPVLQPADEGQDLASDVLDLIAVMCGRLDEFERARLHDGLDRILAPPRKHALLLSDLQQVVAPDPHLGRVSTILGRWVSGELGRFFSRPTNVDLSNPVIGFGVRDVQDELVAPAYYLIATWVWSQLRRVRKRRHLLIDEAGLLFEHPVIRRFMVRLARRIRKYEGSLIIATQNAGDLLSTPEGMVIATNPSILLMGHQRSGEARRLAQAFALTDRQTDGLHHARRGEFLMVAGGNRVPLTISPPPWQQEVIQRSKARTEARATTREDGRPSG